jgi:SAM-dependent methyltransferase
VTATELPAPTQCVVCDTESVRAFAVHEHWIRRCPRCGHHFAEIVGDLNHVHRTYADEYFHGGGAGYPDYLAEGELLRARGRRYAERIAGHVTPGTILDVGAAAGFFLKGFEDRGWTGLGLEPNPRMAAYGRTELGLAIQAGALEDYSPAATVDLVSMIQVVPHFYDLRRAFQVAAAATRPGGWWLIESWDRDSYAARVFGRNWHEYSPPSVLSWFSKRGLVEFAGHFGFHEVASGRAVKWISGAHVKSLVAHAGGSSRWGRAAARAARLVPNGLAVPYPGDDLFWILLQRADASGS